eukprot:1138924-Rhodomonas_salina.2
MFEHVPTLLWLANENKMNQAIKTVSGIGMVRHAHYLRTVPDVRCRVDTDGALSCCESEQPSSRFGYYQSILSSCDGVLSSRDRKLHHTARVVTVTRVHA